MARRTEYAGLAALLALGLLLNGCPDRDGEDWIGVWDGGVPDPDDDDAGDDDSGDDDGGDDDSGDDDTTGDDDTSGDDDTAQDDEDNDGWTVGDGDCDDTDPDIHPGADERCNGLDDDCDGAIPVEETTDEDGDFSLACEDCDDHDALLNTHDLDSDGWTSCDGDCDDWNDDLNLDDADGDAATTCDGDCDDTDATLNLLDLDGDGQDTCSGDCDDNDPAANDLDLDGDGHSSCAGDCDDNDPAVHPNAGEQCGFGVDDNCDGNVDEGCSCPRYVDVSAVGSAEVGSWVDPYLTISLGLADIVGVCDELHVLPGVYLEANAVTGRSVILRSIDGPIATELNAFLSAPVLEWTQGSLVLDGFTLTRGGGLAGGGLALLQSGATITDCIFVDNYCSFTGNGAAINATQSPGLVVLDTELLANHCGAGAPDNGGNGGGIYAEQTDVHLVGLTVVGNTAGDGGGISLHQCTGELRQTLIAGNLADDTEPGLGQHRGGGGLLVEGGSVALDNLLVVDNSSGDRGGGLLTVATGGGVSATNCTFAYNEATAGGAGVHLDPTGSIVLHNSIVAFNDGGSGLDADATVDAPVQTYCDVFGNTALDYGPNLTDLTGVDGNLVVDPLFVLFSDDGDPFDDDLHLDIGSLCIDAGDPDPAYDDLDLSRNDMGAYGGPYGGW